MDISIFVSIIVAEILIGHFDVNDMSRVGDTLYLPKAKAARTIYSFAAIIMWIRFLYFFRIFRTTGYYIRMLV